MFFAWFLHKSEVSMVGVCLIWDLTSKGPFWVLNHFWVIFAWSSCSDHEDQEYHVVNWRTSRWGQEEPRVISPWGSSRSRWGTSWSHGEVSHGHHEVPLVLTVRFLLVATRNLLENVKLDLSPTKREPLGLTVSFVMVTMRSLMVSPWGSSWSGRGTSWLT